MKATPEQEHALRYDGFVYQLQFTIEQYEKMKAEFAKTVDSNPIQAIEWKAEEMVKAQTSYVIALHMLEAIEAVENGDSLWFPEGATVIDVIDEFVKQLERGVRSTPKRSTGLFANAVDSYAHESRVRMLEMIEGYRERLAKQIA